jgi:RNA polymerase sigma-70 factor, ECF subfamily
VPDAVLLRDLVQHHHRRLYVFMRAVLPNAIEAETALRETTLRITERGQVPPVKDFETWAEGIARQVAVERRKSAKVLPFSDDLFRQLADSAEPSLELSERRPGALAELLAQLPQPERELLRRKYELGMTLDQIALAEDRPASAVAREVNALHASLVSALRQSLHDSDLPPPGGAVDLGRLTDHLLDGTINDDGRLILETLLLADSAAQAHYHRHVALTAELTWLYRGEPPLPEFPTEVKRTLTSREWLVTSLFICALVIVAGFISLVVYLRVS